MREDEIHDVAARVLQSGFFAPLGVVVRLSYNPQRSVAWEILGGHLLEPAHTRVRCTFASWEVSLAQTDDSAGPQPLLAVFWDEPLAIFHVIRYLRVHGWEAYEAEPNVILSRPAQKQARELVGTVPAADVLGAADLSPRLQRLVFQALVGTRLPVTSWESPLPAFQLGQCAYLPGLGFATVLVGDDLLPNGANESPIAAISSPEELLRCSLANDAPVAIQAKSLEAALRASAAADVPRLTAALLEGCGEDAADEVKSLFIALFNHVALTPYTHFADHLVALLGHLANTPAVGAATVADIISYMLRHLVRHLTAFDLRTFHNRGANYPDALLLDGLLKAYLELIEHHVQQFTSASGEDARALAGKRGRRRALRQAWIVRKGYEGLKVPRAPTSPGDLQRVLPGEYAGASEEEVLDPAKRRKALFADDSLDRRLTPATQSVLQQSLRDLDYPFDLRELGIATFLDRPLGIAKRPGEIDRTPLLTYEAFSRGVAQQRLTELRRWGLLGQDRHDELAAQLGALTGQSSRHAPRAVGGTRSVPATAAVRGYTGHHGQMPARPGTPCLEDANLAAADFVFLRTTRSSLDEFLRGFDWSELRRARPEDYSWLTQDRGVLLVRVAAGVPRDDQPLLAALDASGELRLDLCLSEHEGTARYVEEDGRERLAEGLVLRPAEPATKSAATASAVTAGRTSMALPSVRPAS